MIKKLLNIRSVSDLKDDLINAAKQIKRQHINPDGHVAVETIARQVAQWVAQNKQALEYKGPTHADTKSDYEAAMRAHRSAKEKEAAAHVAVLQESGGFEGASSRVRAGIHPFDSKLEAVWKSAQRESEVARREEMDLYFQVIAAAAHERAKDAAALILAQILGTD